jgi:hypothetical protein
VHELPPALAASGFCRLGLSRRVKTGVSLDSRVERPLLAAREEVHNDAVALWSFLLGRETKPKTETTHR